MFIFIRHILLMLMGCVITSCGNEVAFEHPTPEDLREARKALGLSEGPNHLTRNKNLASQSFQADFKSESLIPNLSLDLKAQREAYIQEIVDKHLTQTNNYYQQISISSSDIVRLRQLSHLYHGYDWDSKNIPAGTSPANLKAINEDARALKRKQTVTMQSIMKPYQVALQSRNGTLGFNQTTYQQKYTGPEIPISDIVPAERSVEALARLQKRHRQALLTLMKEADITLTQSDIDEHLRLKEMLDEANQTSQKAYKLRSEGNNVTQETIMQLNKKQASIRQNITKITAPLQDAIRIKREPQRRAQQIKAMKNRYERQNKFPSNYDLEAIYDIQKTLTDLNRERSIAMQNQQKTGQSSSSELQELNKSYQEKRTELNRQKREIEARIR